MIITIPMILDGIEVGEIEQHGTELHCTIKDEYKFNWMLHRQALREFMKPYLAQDIVTTNNEISDIQGIRRTTLLGFEETWRDDRFVFFMLKTLPFERKQNAS